MWPAIWGSASSRSTCGGARTDRPGLVPDLSSGERPSWRPRSGGSPSWRPSRPVSALKLHMVFQEAMGWTNSHLHQFRIGDVLYGMHFDDWPDEEQHEVEFKLADVAHRGDRFATTMTSARHLMARPCHRLQRPMMRFHCLGDEVKSAR